MVVLTYYNVSTGAIVTSMEYDSYFTRNIGDYFKVNLMLISKVITEEKTRPVEFTLKKYRDIRYSIGKSLVALGEYIKNGKKNDKVYIYKNRKEWWR